MRFFFIATLLISLIAFAVADIPLKKKPRVLSLPISIEKPTEKPKIVSAPTPKAFQVEITFLNGTSVLVTPETSIDSIASRQNRPNFPSRPNRPPRFNQDVVSAILQSESGISRTTAFGLTVLPGATGKVGYKVKAKAVNGGAIDDSRFFRRLTFEERRRYTALKQRYSNGLNVPLLEFLGGDLSKEFVGKGDFENAKNQGGRFFQLRYGRLSKTAQDILRQYTETTIEASGELTATHTGEIKEPISVFVYLRLALVKVDERTTMTVLSTDGQDVVGADKDGNRESIDSEGTINILVPTRR